MLFTLIKFSRKKNKIVLITSSTILLYINLLMTEVFKYLNGLSPDLMNEVFRLKSNYHNLRNFSQFKTYIPKTKSPLNSCVYGANQLWQLLPHEIRKSMSLMNFKSKISKWLCQERRCHLCKKYIKNVDLLITSTKIDFSFSTCM